MNVHLRKFPFPYQAALAICSDVDNTPSLETYLAMMDFLNSTRSTPLGEGLGLEVGNSFWFYNATDAPQLSYFATDGRSPTDFAPYCRELWESGHLDVLHTWGNFDHGGFQRDFADRATNEIAKYDIKIPVWVNHGNPHNEQNLGGGENANGAVPGHPAYHQDLTRMVGCHFFWLGRMTHILGQEARRNLFVRAHCLGQELMRRVKYRHVPSSQLFDPDNRLLLTATLQDGTKVCEFQRWVNAWGETALLDSNDLTIQLRPWYLRSLIRNQGFLVIYTHFCENLSMDQGIPKELHRNLLYLKQLAEEQKLMVTTTSRLLKYREISNGLQFTVQEEDSRCIIEIQDTIDSADERIFITTADLQGLTFYVDNPAAVQIHFQDQPVIVSCNPRDLTGRNSVSIPWLPLEYPRA